MEVSIRTLYGVADGRYFTDYTDAVNAAMEIHMKGKTPERAFSRENAILLKMVLTTYDRDTNTMLYFHLQPVLRVNEVKDKG